jgi:hypothetical protein
VLHGCFYETNVIGCHGAERVTFERLLEREKLQAECTAAVAEAGHDLCICASSLVSHAQKGMNEADGPLGNGLLSLAALVPTKKLRAYHCGASDMKADVGASTC